MTNLNSGDAKKFMEVMATMEQTGYNVNKIDESVVLVDRTAKECNKN